MTSAGVVQKTVVACSILSIAAVAVATAIGHFSIGIGLAAGLLLGSANGYLIQGLINRGAPFVAASLLRILFFTSIVLIAALILREAAWPLALGIGLAQLVMVAVGVRMGLRS
jgi:hypothetical protein